MYPNWYYSGRPRVTASDYPPVQVTPGGNLKLIPQFSNYPHSFTG